MSKIVAKTGNEAMAEAMRQINPDVVAAYPITPATEIVQIFSSFVSNGEVDTVFVPTESEHSAISACVGAAAAGARVMTGTSSQGLALMHEILFIAGGLRLPIVICEVNRALSAPINIHCDHSDTMASRDAGWIQIFSEDPQEAYDQTILAMKLSEQLFIPSMVTTDGFIISHAMQRVEMYDDREVKEYLGEPKSPYNLLDLDNPITVGPLALQDYYMEIKVQQANFIKESKSKIKEILNDFNKKMKRDYSVVEKYMMDDAEFCFVALGSTAGTLRYTVDKLRKEGKKVGLLKVRFYRPFFEEDIFEALKNIKGCAIFDRSDMFAGTGGHLFNDIKSALYNSSSRPFLRDYVYGLGGRDIDVEDIENVYNDIKDFTENHGKGESVKYITVRE
uniref:Pyruvate ferredoxin oxidoreductase n=1 Tax=candidate division WOR-3 bacterium TaxID=2052148 RepID=A0A7C3J6M4_UNCW3